MIKLTKLDEFKTFVTTIPNIKEEVLNGRYTWQQLYEIYVMYGKDDKFWQPYRNSSSGLDLSSIIEVVKNVDMNALSNSLNAIEKVLNMASGLFGKEEEPKPRQKTKWYDE